MKFEQVIAGQESSGLKEDNWCDIGLDANLTLPVLCIYEIYIKLKINLNFYFHSSL